MRFLLSLALPAFIVSAVAKPTPQQDIGALAKKHIAELKKRQSYSPESTVSTLYTNILPHTGAINSTAAGLNCESTAADNATAAKSFDDNLNAISFLLQGAANDTLLSSVPAGAGILLTRQASNGTLAEEVENLVLEISGALNGIVATLGLSALTGSLSPLVLSLSMLLLSLENVVDNLLVVVKELLDGLLTGLSIGLAGLIY